MTRLISLDPRESELWAQLASAPSASVFVSPSWLATLADTYGIDCCAAIVMDGDVPRSGLVYAVIDDIVGRRAQSLPFSDYADPVLGDDDDLALLLDSLLAEADAGAVRARVLHAPRSGFEQHMVQAGEAAWHAISIGSEGETTDYLWDRLGGTARRNVRKARDAGVTVTFRNDADAVATFFDLHLGTRKRRYRLLPQPFAFFQNMHKRFSAHDGYWLAIAEFEGRPVAAVSLLEWNGVAYYKFNASSGESLSVRPNDLLMWECMVFAGQRGNGTLDLGLSDLEQPGLIRYKSKFATAESRISTYVAGPDPDAAVVELKQLFGVLTEALTDESVPDWATARAGDLFYQYFS